MSSNPSPLPPVSPSSLSPLSSAVARLPISVDRARDVITANLALLRAILRDPSSSITASDGRFVSARDSLRALHLELEDQWFSSQLEVGNSGAIVVPKKPRASRVPRGPRKVAGALGSLGSSPLNDPASAPDATDPQSSIPGRSSLLEIAGVPVRISPPVIPGFVAGVATLDSPLSADDIPEMPRTSGLSLPVKA